jgi:hypothetical protein
MSPFFVRYFRSNNPCPSCPSRSPADKASGKSLCGPHLALARIVWRLWSMARRRLGKCIDCTRKVVPGNCRCKGCRSFNIKKSKAYYHTNRDTLLKTRRDWKEAFIAEGKCPGCPEHRALSPGRRRCDSCQERQHAYTKGDIMVVEASRAERAAFKTRRNQETEKQLRDQLAQMGYTFSLGDDGGKHIKRIERT